MRHLDAAEVVEVVRLAKARVARRSRRSLHDREGVGADRVVDLRAARGELLRRKVGRERGEPSWARLRAETRARANENPSVERRDGIEILLVVEARPGPHRPAGERDPETIYRDRGKNEEQGRDVRSLTSSG